MSDASSLNTAAADTKSSVIQGFLRKVERTNLMMIAASIVLSHLLVGTGDFVVGVLVGGLLGLLNFRALVWLAGRMSSAPGSNIRRYTVLFFLKLSLVIVVVGLVLTFVPMNPLGFLVGVATLLPAILITSLQTVLAPAPTNSEQSA